MANGIVSAAAMAEWVRVLDRVQQSLERAVADADAHDRALAAQPGPAGGDPARPTLERIDEHLRGLQARLEAAGGAAAEVELLLHADEREVRAWQAAAAVLAERLGAASRLR